MTETTASATQPWEVLAQIIESGDAQHLAMFVPLLPPEDTAYTINQLTEAQQTAFWSMLGSVRPEFAADLFEHFSDEHAADMIEQLEPSAAAAIFDEMDSDEQTDVLAELDEQDADAILQKMDPEEARDVRERLAYPEDTAGGLMITEYLAYRSDRTVQSVIADLREHSDEYASYESRYVYVIDDRDRLVGIVAMRSLVFAAPDRRLIEVAMQTPMTVRDSADLDELENLFDRVDYSALPVVDEEGVLCGIVQRAHVQEALHERSTEAFRMGFGIIGGEELRSMPVSSRWARRLTFLIPNLMLSALAVSIIGAYDHIIEQITVLAVFLPLVANLSGAAGNQAVAVSIRELTLNLIMPRDVMRVVWKELLIGAANGLAIGSILCGAVWLTQGQIWPLAVVVGGAYAINSVLAVCMGGILPLILKALKVDPAMMSSPILTTLTDMGSFAVTLSLAAAALAMAE